MEGKERAGCRHQRRPMMCVVVADNKLDKNRRGFTILLPLQCLLLQTQGCVAHDFPRVKCTNGEGLLYSGPPSPSDWENHSSP